MSNVDAEQTRRGDRTGWIIGGCVAAVVVVAALIAGGVAMRGADGRPTEEGAAYGGSTPVAESGAPNSTASPTPDPVEMATVPAALVGMNAEAASAALTAAGFDAVTKGAAEGLVAAADPAPGTEAEVGSEVTLTLTAPAPLSPAQAEAAAMAQALRERLAFSRNGLIEALA